MTTTINASPSNGIVQTADGSGVMKLQSNGVTTNALAWVNYKGTATRAINASYNISSVTYNASGDYTFNFATTLTDANYAVTGMCQQNGGTLQGIGISTSASPTTSACRVVTGYANNGTTYDSTLVCIAIFGN